MDLVERLVEIESQDASEGYGAHVPWAGSDEARAARAAVEQRIEKVIEFIHLALNNRGPEEMRVAQLNMAIELLTGEMREFLDHH